MHEVKYHKGFCQPYPVSMQSFAEQSHEQVPYMVYGKNGKEAYAYCPICENPVRLLGIYKPLANGDKPHARHVGDHDNPFHEYNEYRYLHCPEHRRRANYVCEIDPGHVNPEAEVIRDLAIKQADRCLYLISKASGLLISDALAEAILFDYFATPGYLMSDATFQNLPWFMARCMSGKNLIGRTVRKDSPLYTLLKDKSEICLIPNKYGLRINKSPNIHKYLEISLCFTNYRFSVIDNTMHDYLKIHLATPDGMGAYMEYAAKEVEVDPYAFVHLCHAKNTYRNQKWLDMAKQYQK